MPRSVGHDGRRSELTERSGSPMTPRAPDERGVHRGTSVQARLLALQQTAGNRAVAQLLSRDASTKSKPKVASAAEIAQAQDPLNFDAFSGWWWWGVGPALDGTPDERRIREVLVEESAVNAKVLAESSATLIKAPGDTPYYVFRHRTRGVVARALVGRSLGVSKRIDGSPGPSATPLRVFLYSPPRGGDPLGTSAAGDDKAAAERELKGMPPELIAALGGRSRFDELKKADPERLLRIALKLSALSEAELKLFKGLDKLLTDDLDVLDASVDAFIAQRDRYARDKAKGEREGKGEPSLEQQLAEAWKGAGPKAWGSMNRAQREITARRIAAAQTKTRLKHMVKHPGETLVDMGKGIVLVDELGDGIWKDIQ
jgi:hypothetical protein